MEKCTKPVIKLDVVKAKKNNSNICQGSSLIPPGMLKKFLSSSPLSKLKNTVFLATPPSFWFCLPAITFTEMSSILTLVKTRLIFTKFKRLNM